MRNTGRRITFYGQKKAAGRTKITSQYPKIRMTNFFLNWTIFVTLAVGTMAIRINIEEHCSRFFNFRFFCLKPPPPPWNQYGNRRFFVHIVAKFVVIPGGGGGFWKNNKN